MIGGSQQVVAGRWQVAAGRWQVAASRWHSARRAFCLPWCPLFMAAFLTGPYDPQGQQAQISAISSHTHTITVTARGPWVLPGSDSPSTCVSSDRRRRGQRRARVDGTCPLIPLARLRTALLTSVPTCPRVDSSETFLDADADGLLCVCLQPSLGPATPSAALSPSPDTGGGSAPSFPRVRSSGSSATRGTCCRGRRPCAAARCPTRWPSGTTRSPAA